MQVNTYVNVARTHWDWNVAAQWPEQTVGIITC